MHRLAVCALAVVSAVKQRGPQATRGTTVTEQCEACSLAVMSARNTVMKAVHKGAKKAAPPTKAQVAPLAGDAPAAAPAAEMRATDSRKASDPSPDCRNSILAL